MNLNSKVTLAVGKFFKRYGKVILIVFAVWLTLFLFNRYLKNKPKELKATTSYNSNEPIMDEGQQVPKKEVSKVNQAIDEYFNYCNSKEYESAFNMLTNECKNSLFDNNLEQFKEYIDGIYNKKKIYNIQNYSNAKNIYIYDINILDDIAATGTTGDYEKYKEKIVIHNLEDGIKISVLGYVGRTILERETEDDNMKVKVLYKEMSYEREEYTLEIRNKIDSIILISDEIGGDQITLNLGKQSRMALNTVNSNILLYPGQTKTIKLLFTKYFDDGVIPEQINFNNVRILSNFHSAGVSEDDILKQYVMNINLK